MSDLPTPRIEPEPLENMTAEIEREKIRLELKYEPNRLLLTYREALDRQDYEIRVEMEIDGRDYGLIHYLSPKVDMRGFFTAFLMLERRIDAAIEDAHRRQKRDTLHHL